MALFNQTKTVAQPPAMVYKNARTNLLITIAFTLVNIILLIVDGSVYFLFSAYIPYSLVSSSKFLCGLYPAEFYEELGYDVNSIEFLPEAAFYISLAIAAVILVVYLLCFIFSKKNRYGWLIAALVFFAVDTVLMVLGFDFSSFDIYTILDVVFHAWIIFILVKGIMAGLKLSKLPVTEVAAEFVPVSEEAPEAKLNGESADISEK